MVGPIRRARIGLAMAALASAVAPAVASADAPVIERAPRLVGSALVGARLDAVGARWRGWPSPPRAGGGCAAKRTRCGVARSSRALLDLVHGHLGRPRQAPARAGAGQQSRRPRLEWSSATAPVAAPPPPVVTTPTPTPSPSPTPPPPPPPVVSSGPACPCSRRSGCGPEPLVRIRGWLTSEAHGSPSSPCVRRAARRSPSAAPGSGARGSRPRRRRSSRGCAPTRACSAPAPAW